MEESDLSARLEDLYTLVRLHGWCNQLVNGIADIVPILSPGNQLSGFSRINAEIGSDAATKREIVLSIVLLKKTGTPVSQITDIVYSKLADRLDFKDINFLLQVFFNNKQPLPSSLTYDITNKVYLSFRRALKRALEIDSVMSFHNPEVIVLYLTLLLCRVDLNKENKAIVFFLLSRVDVDLPPIIAEGVSEYIKGIQAIIEEVASSEEEIFEHEDFGDGDIAPTVATARSLPTKAKEKITEEKSVFPAGPGQIQKQPEHRQKKEFRRGKDKKEQTTAVDWADRNRYQGIISKTGGTAGQATTYAGSLAAKRDRLSLLGRGKSIRAALKTIPSRFSYFSERILNRQAPILKTVAKKKNKVTESPRFLINFSRNTEELLSILQGLDKKKPLLSSGKKTRERLRSSFYSSFWRCSIIIPFIIALGICTLTVPRWITHSSWLADKDPGEIHSADMVSGNIGRGEEEAVPVETTERISSGSTSQFFFKKSGQALYWVVAEGNSFWDLHRFLAESRALPYMELKYLGNLTWERYLDILTELNPDRDLQAIIYPGEAFLLSSP